MPALIRIRRDDLLEDLAAAYHAGMPALQKKRLRAHTQK